MKHNKILIAIIIGVFVFGLIVWNRDRRALKKDYALALGEVYDLETNSKSPDIFVKYYFQVGTKKYQSHSSIDCPKVDCLQFTYQLLNGKALYVIYERSNPKNSEMLFSIADYLHYKIKLEGEQKDIVLSLDSLIEVH
jgi:hypothetical protein